MIAGLRKWAFDPVDPAPMAAMRILCGVLVFFWAVSYLPAAQAFLANDGLVPKATTGTAGFWSLPVVSPYGIVLLLAAAGIALAVGWHSRVSSVAVAFLLLVIQRRDIYPANSGDDLLRLFAIYLSLMPSGEIWSLDERRRGWSEDRSPWGMRLLQLQLSLLYLSSVDLKLSGAPWQNGSAVGIALQIGDVQRIPVPHALAVSTGVSALLTYGTLLGEAFLVFGMWFPKTRYYAIAAGVALHLGIEATLLIGFFSLTILSTYLSFVPGEDLRQALAWVQEQWRDSSFDRWLRRHRPPKPRRRPAKEPASVDRPASEKRPQTVAADRRARPAGTRPPARRR